MTWERQSKDCGLRLFKKEDRNEFDVVSRIRLFPNCFGSKLRLVKLVLNWC